MRTVEWFETWERGVTALAELDAITIAAIQGYCLGGGLQVALEERALAMAQELLSIPFPALLYTKHQIDRAFGQDTMLLLDEMTAVYEDCLRSPEHATVRTDLLAREKKT
jgi:enoyl-CoA hydratase/carnithine racemase